MAGSFSVYLEKKVLDHVLGGVTYTPPSTVYFATFTVAPTASGGGTETSGLGYARVAIANNATSFPAATGGAPSTKTNGVNIVMAAATGLWSLGANQTSWGLYDAASGGNLLMFGDLTPNQPILLGNILSLGIGIMQVNLT